MASTTTVKIQDTLNWCFAYILGRVSSGAGGFTNEPGLTNANLILSTILAPPFAWSWNRFTDNSTSTVKGTQDYAVSLQTFGWLEKASLTDANGKEWELELYGLESKESVQARPRNIVVFKDDNNGNITFRLFPVPDGVYTLTLTYQKAPPLAATLGTTTWTPIPDKLAFLYERAMLAQLHAIYDTTAYLQELQIFFRQLVGAAEGLTETEKALFLEDSLRYAKTSSMALQATQASPKRGA